MRCTGLIAPEIESYLLHRKHSIELTVVHLFDYIVQPLYLTMATGITKQTEYKETE